MKTIFITSFHVLISRNILCAPILKLLTERGWRVVLIMPKKKEEYFRKTFGGPQVFAEGVPNKLDRRDDLFKDLALAAVRTSSLRTMRRRQMGIERPVMQKVFFFAPLVRRFIPYLYRLTMPRHSFRELFERYRPSIVFSTDVFSSSDCRILHEARVHGVPTLGMVRSWDNLTTKGGFRVVPDTLLVHNEFAKNEAIRFHGIHPSRMRVIGIPHYDNYIHPPKISRAEFLRQMGIPEDKTFFVYAPLGDRIMKVGNVVHTHFYDGELIPIIERCLPPNAFLIVRFPPTDTVTVDRTRLSPRVIFSYPGVRFGEGVGGIRSSEMSREDDESLFNAIYYSNGVVNSFSSIFVDALFIDRPIIVPAFDPKPVSYWESVRRVEEFEHLKPVMGSAAVKTAWTPEELAAHLRFYAEDKTRDAPARAALMEKECFSHDGKSSERLLAVIEKTPFTPALEPDTR